MFRDILADGEPGDRLHGRLDQQGATAEPVADRTRGRGGNATQIGFDILFEPAAIAPVLIEGDACHGNENDADRGDQHLGSDARSLAAKGLVRNARMSPPTECQGKPARLR